MQAFDRRRFLAAALAAGGVLTTSRLAFARAPTPARFVFVVLRGALDGLAAVPPYGDPDYAPLRRELALPAPGSADGALRLDEVFALHPRLVFLRECYAARELVVFHAIATAYRERSHFDGQDVLENGFPSPHAADSGWLNRALASLSAGGASERRELGVALGRNVPLVMRGPAPIASWSPSRLAALDEDTLDRIADLYARDALLSQRLADAVAAKAMASAPQRDVDGRRAGARYAEIMRATAGFLRREDGPRVAVLDATGWDTHANEGAAEGQLAVRLAALDAGLRTLKEQLGPVWADTAVVVATEFGRTAAANGTRGTDHGTGAAAFLLGGAVEGGRIVADWPGLSLRALHEGRDLKPTLDLRSVLKGVLGEHLGVASRALELDVFPGSGSAAAVTGLVKG